MFCARCEWNANLTMPYSVNQCVIILILHTTAVFLHLKFCFSPVLGMQKGIIDPDSYCCYTPPFGDYVMSFNIIDWLTSSVIAKQSYFPTTSLLVLYYISVGLLNFS